MTHKHLSSFLVIVGGLIGLSSTAQAEEKPSSVLTALSATTLSGYVDTSIQWNEGSGNAHVPDYAFGGPSKADGFNLNVVDLVLEKPMDTGEAWGAGYKVELFLGPDADALATQSTGATADFAVKQAYVSLHTPVGNGLDFKLGVWDTITGYEVTDSIYNPNFTRSYGYTIEPSSHTGLQAAYQFSEVISVLACVANTFGSQINQRAPLPDGEWFKTYMGSITLTAPTNWGWLAGSTLTGCIISGYNSGAPGGPANQTSFYAGATINTPVKGFKMGVCYDYASVNAQDLTSGQSAYANAVGVYASYQLTEKLGLFMRGEYASSDTEVLLATKLFETTATLQYDLWKNVLSRLEFRWDHAADGSTPYGGQTASDPGTRSNSYILIASIAYKF